MRVAEYAPQDPAQWFVLVLVDDGHPEAWRIVRRAKFTGSQRGAERLAHEKLMQGRAATRNKWPIWAEVMNDDTCDTVYRCGEVPDDVLSANPI